MRSVLDAIATEPQYVAHVLPVWLATARRGVLWVGSADQAKAVRAAVPGESVWVVGAAAMDAPVLVASHRDHAIARRRGARAVAVMEHGCGQSYAGDRRLAGHPSYAGGRGRDCDLVLAPNRFAADRWLETYPDTPVEVIGATRPLSPPDAGAPPLLVVSFHWAGAVAELRGALQHYRLDLAAIAETLPVAGHAHPRFAGTARRVFAKAGIPYIEDLEEVARRATVYAVDNSSTLWELGRTRPTIAMNAPWYRREVVHGLRFWSHAGASVDGPSELAALADRLLFSGEYPEETAAREDLVAEVIPYLDGASRAAIILTDWLRRAARAATKAGEDLMARGSVSIRSAGRTVRSGHPTKCSSSEARP